MIAVTQNDVNKAIDYFIENAVRYEELRDSLPFESEAYWAAHDAAINLHLSAEALMPRSRTRHVNMMRILNAI